MRHVPEGKLRRLVDEPNAVALVDAEHVAGCTRCRVRREEVERNAAAATSMLARPQPVPDVDIAWARFLAGGTAPTVSNRARRRAPLRWHRRFVVLPLPSTAALATVAIVVVGAGATAVLTTVLAPKQPAPVTESSADFQALADVAGFNGGSEVLGGYPTSSGSLRLPFGVLQWSAAGRAHRVGSIASAEEASGLRLSAPAVLPDGVGPVSALLVQPKVTATIRFDAAAGPSLAGTSLTVEAGPAVLIEYGSRASGLGLPPLATFVMERPVAVSTKSSPPRLEAFLLSHPGVPVGLAQEIRLLGDLSTVLPVPSAPGASVTQVDVDGSPGVLVQDSTGAASGVIWEDRGGTVRAAVGLLDEKDILDVADQLG